jgi:hypothetical protein
VGGCFPVTHTPTATEVAVSWPVHRRISPLPRRMSLFIVTSLLQ